MRILSLTAVLFVGILLSFPALAGKVAYVDGKGQWTPTTCTAPEAPAGLSKNAEAAANDLNAAVAAHNAFATAAQAYMACVSREAQNDSEAFGQLITGSAQSLIDQTQRDVAASAAQVKAKSGK